MSENDDKRAGAYDFTEIESRWQKYWESNKTFAAANPGMPEAEKPKFYCLDMFPYPSGAGLHVGHPEGYTASDIVSRYKRMRGFNVLHPMGYDAFGLPAEQYAIQTGVHPRITTQQNIDNIRRQIKSLGFSYDWDRELATTDPAYYKWTQWIFLKLFGSWYDAEAGKARPIGELPIPDGVADARAYRDGKRLAYLDEVAVNWCPALGTVLANEEVTNEGLSDRGNHPVERRPMRQWMLRITTYAERLLADLEQLDWTEPIKLMQRNWIGRSEGANVDFTLAGDAAEKARANGLSDILTVYTTRPDTLFGATYMVLAPEHPLVTIITAAENADAINAYCKKAAMKTDLDRTDLAKEKSGVFTGAFAVNPASGEKIPIWVADYVLISYGTGAIMAVPAHDTRDFEFASQFEIPIRCVVLPTTEAVAEEYKNSDTPPAKMVEQVAAGTRCFSGKGTAVNSGEFDGQSTPEFAKNVTAWLDERGAGKFAVNFKLRDWLFSRQRYWGEPFPLLHGPDGEIRPVDEAELPLVPPELEDYKPTGDPVPPLAKTGEWTVVEIDGVSYKRELNTMPQWAGSCWYYLRYLDPTNELACVDPANEKYWMPVDLYVGGAEHAVLHLLYSRFWHKVLYDLGVVSTNEPFTKLVNQGMILAYTYQDSRGANVNWHDVEEKDGKFLHKQTGDPLRQSIAKMSKSLGNVVNPDEVIRDYGADSMRLYEMFMGPLHVAKPWNMQGVDGVHRFLNRVWRLVVGKDGEMAASIEDVEPDRDQQRILHQTIRKVTGDVDAMAFNTAISQMMMFVNALTPAKVRPRSVIEPFVLLLAPFAPHIAEELWSRLGHEKSLAYEPWPQYDESLATEDQIELPVLINGKVRARIQVSPVAGKADLEAAAMANEKVQANLAGKTVRKIIAVPGKLVNIVAN